MPDATLSRLAEIAGEAGRIAHNSWRGEFNVWEKSPGHKVCDVDIAVNDFLREALTALDPDAGFLSEESVDDASRLDSPRVWIVDPIDGTRDFIRGREGWCISVALVEEGQPLIGVLDAPARGEVWTAQAGKGARRNGDPLAVSGRTELPGARVPMTTLPRGSEFVGVHQPNSIALRIGMVGSAEADLLATLRWGHEWDVAASALIAREAGATVTDAFGEPLTFNTHRAEAFGVVAATPGIHAAAIERLAERAKKAVVR
ncbi:3'(2'),5'-bisphosphate nucleotidase CysQ [uncultured Parasphingopyxis sp.]|uniref:3'(2'),5'-bisphosphate nucleotidase CysQ n=1 Tax=uncultured Parasphingopyxis sp. TaxID=1547918 RepID=UPI00263530F4|nr:3'(2'),5'-bisphosphate nucleotidase CysQ [uncultured Parasphingopyxis sp.]